MISRPLNAAGMALMKKDNRSRIIVNVDTAYLRLDRCRRGEFRFSQRFHQTFIETEMSETDDGAWDVHSTHSETVLSSDFVRLFIR